MELFTIQCTTCRVRLKVKDESAIGDILACPKCGSMVQVVPPVGWKRASDAVVVAAAGVAPIRATAPSVTPLPAIPAHVTPRNATPPHITPPHITPTASSASTPALSVTAAAAPSPATPPALPPRPAPSVDRSAGKSPVETPAQADAAATIPSPAGASWSAAIVERVKTDWPLLAGGLGAGAVLGAIVWMLVGSGTPEPEMAAAITTSATVPSIAEDAPPATIASESSVPPGIAPTAAVTPPEQFAAEVPPTANAPQEAAEPVPAAAEAPADRLPSASGAALAGNPPEPAAVESKPAIRLDPAEAPAPLGDPLDVDLANPQPSAADAPPAAEEPRRVAAANAPPANSGATSKTPKLSQSEVHERLSTALPRVKFVRVPLIEFVRFVADFSTVEITIDDASLARLGKKRQTPITVELADTTLDDALRAAIKPLGLDCVFADGKLVVTAAQAAR